MRAILAGFGRQKSHQSTASSSSGTSIASSRTSVSLIDSKLAGRIKVRKMSGRGGDTNPTVDAAVKSQFAEGPYCPRRPTLSELLADEAYPPWDLEAFKTYCRSKLNDENVCFVLEAQEYEKKYNEWRSTASEPPTEDDISNGKSVVVFYKQVLTEYIDQNGPKSVNIDDSVRRKITSAPESEIPTDPHILHPAVTKVKELLSGSILPNFLIEVQPEVTPDGYLDPEYNTGNGGQHKPRSIHLPTSSPVQSPASISYAPMAPPSGTGARKRHYTTSSTGPRPKSWLGTESQASLDSAVSGNNRADALSLSSRTTKNGTPPPQSPPPADSRDSNSKGTWTKFKGKLNKIRKELE